MEMQYIGEIRLMAFDFAPSPWEPCDGRLLTITDRTRSLSELLGTTYGGDGRTNFGLPDLRGAAAVHRGTYRQGERAGAAGVVLNWPEVQLPGHTHQLIGTMDVADSPLPTERAFATAGANVYAPFDPTKQVTLPAGTVQSVGGQPHENMAPYVAITFCIAILGSYPSPD